MGDQMHDARRMGDPKAIEAFWQSLDLVAPGDAVWGKMRGRSRGIVGLQLERELLPG
jgi:hypothetical protein